MGEVDFLSPANFLGEKWVKNLRLESFMTGLGLSCFRAESEKWSLVNVVRSTVMVFLNVMAWFARLFLVFLPHRIPFYGLFSSLVSSSGHRSSHDPPSAPMESELDHPNVITSGPIGRALVRVLALVNDLPASSRKYSFARHLAEKIIKENTAHGRGYESVNRAALSASFKRTLGMLNQSLAGVHQQRSSSVDLWGLSMKLLGMIPMIPSGGLKFVLPLPLSLLRTQIGYFIPFFAATSSTATIANNSGDVFPSPALSSSIVGNKEMAEKLAQELLWLAEKLAETSALDEGIAQWSSSSSLASISLASSPRIQRALIRLSALFVTELVTEHVAVGGDVKFNILLLWLPLFCTATHGGDQPIFSVSERVDIESTLDKVIKDLPDADQEIILGIWLQEFAFSSSDWPNLQPCYDRWCNTTRKLSHQERLVRPLRVEGT